MTPRQSVAPMKLARFYPIVPDIDWLERLVPLGVETIQLRMKDMPEAEVLAEASAALAFAATHRCQLILNDYWEVAVRIGCDAVHLGQEDLRAADLTAIRAAGIRIGISTHCVEELETALAAQPDYVALGPIYPTRLKKMPWQPQGLARVAEWKERIGDVPLVGIGGITPDLAGGVIAAGADSVAVITDFMSNSNPEDRVRCWLGWARQTDNGDAN